MHPCPLQKIVGGESRVELLGRQEMVMHAVDLAGPRCARRGGDDAFEFRDLGDQAVAQRALAGAGWAGDDEEDGDIPVRHLSKNLGVSR